MRNLTEVDCYNILNSPVITEKTTALSTMGKYVFFVSRDSNKKEILKAVESLFNVSVLKVNTINCKPKPVVFRKRKGFTKNYKKAIVTLKHGDNIDFSTEV